MHLVARHRTNIVKSSSLVSRLRREITASPKKAAILGLLLVVAIGYWAPMIWGWFAPESTASEQPHGKTTSATEAIAKPAVLATPHNVATGTGKNTWRDVSQWIHSDPRTVAVADPPGRPHPFDPVEPPASTVVAEKEKQTQDTAAQIAAAMQSTPPDPASLGVVLSSTVIGPRSQAALINGRSYRLGETIRLDDKGRSIEFQLAEIRADNVILQRGEKKYEIRLPEPATSGRLEITPAGPD